MDTLRVVGARQHNLKGISCELPRNRLVVITGPSGSGKSSLAFDTIYAEGQRRYVESLSAYARQFLDQLPRPDVESIEGLSPAIAIEQRPLARNPRSTVGTVTELSDHLRVLFANVGIAHCPISGVPLIAHTPQDIVDELLELPEGARIVVLAPLGRALRGDLTFELEHLRRQGFVRARVDGHYVEVGDELSFDAAAEHALEVVVDRLLIKSGDGSRQRVTDSVELALDRGKGTLLLDLMDGSDPWVRSERLVSWEHGIELPPLEPRLFSFNSPYGACPECSGLGLSRAIDPDRVIGNPQASLRQGALVALGPRGSKSQERDLKKLERKLGVDLDTPWSKLSEEDRKRVLFGEVEAEGRKSAARWRSKADYPGVVAMLEGRLAESGDGGDDEGGPSGNGAAPSDLLGFTHQRLCPSCGGSRLRSETRHVEISGHTFADLSHLPLSELLSTLDTLQQGLDGTRAQIARPLLDTLRSRIRFLVDVGLAYLSLDRAASTLSSGEGQRVRLATQIGSALVGVLYVLDEPSVGLHPRDNARLLEALRALVDKGNTVVVVEHDRELILAADYVLDLGPAAGEGGGYVMAAGTPEQIRGNPRSTTGPYLGAKRPLTAPRTQRGPGEARIEITGVCTHNLDSVDVAFPLQRLTTVTGVSGSGKSSLVIDTLLDVARQCIAGAQSARGQFDRISGLEPITKVIGIDQAPIGRTPRSNPATYSGILSQLRELYSNLPEARARGYKPGRFSFNVKGGRCEKCKGDGSLRVEMHFLTDLYVPCDACSGRRYNRETLEIRYRGANIAEALALTVDDASELFSAIPRVAQTLTAFRQLGLGYLRLGQPAPTLSGGEAQRLKLATELARPTQGHALYVLDEPTSGLHFKDVELLLDALFALRDAGHTLVVIEHHPEFIACSDWVVDLGPEGGSGGGTVIATGTPREVAARAESQIGRFLLPLFDGSAS